MNWRNEICPVVSKRLMVEAGAMLVLTRAMPFNGSDTMKALEKMLGQHCSTSEVQVQNQT